MCQKSTFTVIQCAIIERKRRKKMFKENFVQNITRARKSAKMTQQYVSDVLSISRTNITKYENGTLEPNIETIGQLAELYNVSTDWLFGITKHN